MVPLPPAGDPTPALHSPRFECLHCGVIANQTWEVPTYDRTYFEARVVEGESYAGTRQESLWNAARCGGCELWSFWRDGELVYPVVNRVGPPAHRDMPDKVRELYDEAAQVAPLSRRAGAALARAMVERLLKDMDPEAPERAPLDALVKRALDKVSTPLAELLDVVRVVGNGAVHLKDVPHEIVVMALNDEDGPEIIELLLGVANNLVDELITRPAATRRLWDKLPESVRDRRSAGKAGG